jgi:hypothetical protein
MPKPRSGEAEAFTNIIQAVLVLLWEDFGSSTQDEWFGWGNGNSPYEHVLDVIKEKFDLDYEIDWAETKKVGDLT